MNFSNYLSKVIFGFILFISFHATSQQQHTIMCTMDQRQVLQSQSFAEDAPEAEIAREIFKNFTNTMTLAYQHINSNSLEEVQLQILAIQTYISEFQTRGLNYSMYQDDIQFITTYN